MKERIKELRSELDLTQQKFADKLGVKRNTVGQWECGINAVTDQVINAICREFNVSEEWLRNGTGEMFVKQTRDEEIISWIGKLQMNDTDSFKKRFVSILTRLSEDQWELLEDIAVDLAENSEKKEQKKD